MQSLEAYHFCPAIQCSPPPIRAVPLSRSLACFSPIHFGLRSINPASTFHARLPSMYNDAPFSSGSTSAPRMTLAMSFGSLAGRPAFSHVEAMPSVSRVFVIQGQIALVLIGLGLDLISVLEQVSSSGPTRDIGKMIVLTPAVLSSSPEHHAYSAYRRTSQDLL